MSQLEYRPEKMTWNFYQEYSKHLTSAYKFGVYDTYQKDVLNNDWLVYNIEFLKEWDNGRGCESAGDDTEIDG